MTAGHRPIAPPATIGILGGGQLGRMTALAARSMGYRIHVLDPDPNCAAAPVADRCLTAAFDDDDAARDLARGCDVVTLEIEQIATAVLDAAQAYAPTRPNSAVIGVVQERARQKRWLTDKGFPVGEFRVVQSAADLKAALATLGDCFIKSNRGGYDGRSQARERNAARADAAWQSVGARPAVAERALDLKCEISVMVARSQRGDVETFPVALNHHEHHVLAWSMLPAPIPAGLASRAIEIGRGIAEAFPIEGLLAIEMFVTTSGDLLVNELAPRPHNSFHASERACVTAQFEQLARAVCNMPLGDTSVVRPAAIVNVFGDLWKNGEPPFADALRAPSARLHLYGKGQPRPGRKMGHISATGVTAQDALAVARQAAAVAGVTVGVPDSLREFGLQA